MKRLEPLISRFQDGSESQRTSRPTSVKSESKTPNPDSQHQSSRHKEDKEEKDEKEELDLPKEKVAPKKPVTLITKKKPITKSQFPDVKVKLARSKTVDNELMNLVDCRTVRTGWSNPKQRVLVGIDIGDQDYHRTIGYQILIKKT